ncbi:hypothetical protein [Listeria phage List-36]|uniref:Uncharacterized protein n=1 Tax=Listeria phage List-36 TaxID=1486422 RepID=A0A060AL88_9CAUD|nr:hypothetical protein HH35_gp125 [Listeria phage List-36]AIA64327.1 hypothetical protein [Listeria phage List-36]
MNLNGKTEWELTDKEFASVLLAFSTWYLLELELEKEVLT